MQVSDDGGGLEQAQFTVAVSSAKDTDCAARVSSFTTTRKGKNLATMMIGFSKSMVPGGAPCRLARIASVSAGKDRKFGTKDDKVLALGTVAFDPSRPLATLTAAKRVRLKQSLQLTVTGSGGADG